MRLVTHTRTIAASVAVVGTLAAGIAVVAVRDGGSSISTSPAGIEHPATTTAAQPARPAPPDEAPPDDIESAEPQAESSQSGNDDSTADATVADDSTADDSTADGSGEFVDTEPIDGEPGVVSGNDNVDTDPPPVPDVAMQVAQLVAVPKPPPPAPPAPDPIDILDVGGNGPAAPAVVVTDFQIPIDNSIGELAPNISGCALQCVSKAMLIPNVTTPNLGLDVAAHVPARIDISLTNTATGDELLFTSNGLKTLWSTTLTPLAAGAEYDLVLEAFDEENQRRVHTHTFTTRAPLELPDQLQDNQPGCAGTCITQATVSPTDRHDEVRFDIETNTDAQIKVWASASEPGWVDGTPFLPAEDRVEPTLGKRMDWSVEKAYFDTDTTYHVVVRAEDDNGVDYQVGEFTMGPPPPVNVRLTFEYIFVQWDGDPHWGGLDRGELSFVWGLYDGDLDWEDRIGSRSEAKLRGGDSVTLGGDNGVWQTLDGDDVFLSPGITAYERDDPPGIEFGGPIALLQERPVDLGSSGRMNPAWGPRLTLDEIKAQQTCGEMGFEGALPTDYCVSFDTQDLDDQEYPNIQVIVSYHIDT